MKPPSTPRPPKGVRRLLVEVLLLGLVLAHLFAVAFDREAWPVSQYPMYSTRFTGEFALTELYGVTPDGNEVALRKSRYWTPFGNVRVAFALARIRGEAEKQEALAYLFDRYEARRAAGAHDGPKLRSLRVYRSYWQAQPDASNAREADRRELRVELGRTE